MQGGTVYKLEDGISHRAGAAVIYFYYRAAIISRARVANEINRVVTVQAGPGIRIAVRCPEDFSDEFDTSVLVENCTVSISYAIGYAAAATPARCPGSRRRRT